MVYTQLTRKAINIAYNAHMGQEDKFGIPYIFHPMHLAEQMDTEEECVVAILHDVVEDTDVTFDMLEKEFPNEVIEALRLLTRDKEKDYFNYINGLKDNPIAKKVKMADLRHNMDNTRLLKVTKRGHSSKRKV